jgi:hypothetical protein
VGLSYGIASGALSLFFTVSRFWKGKMKPCQLAAHHSRAIAGGPNPPRLMQPQVDRRRALGFGRKIRRNEAGSLEHTHGLVRWIAAVANDDERAACLPTRQH